MAHTTHGNLLAALLSQVPNMQQTHVNGRTFNSQDVRTIVRCSRVLNYDLARWITELRPQLQSKQQALHLEMDEASLPPVLCDRQQLQQVVINLVTTAHTVTDPGGQITVVARAAGRFIKIEVRDTGAVLVGPRRVRELEPFVRRIVEAHGGSAVVQRDGSGQNIFAFTIPVHDERTSVISISAA